MRYFVTLVVLVCVVASSFSRPSHMNEPVDADQEDMEYEGEEEAAVDDTLRDDDGSRLEKQEPAYAEEEEEAVETSNTEGKRGVPSTSGHQKPKDKCDSVPDDKMQIDRESEDMKPNDSDQQQPLQQRPSRYIEAKEAKEQSDLAQNFANMDKREKFARRAVFNRRNIKTTTDDKGEELFENAVARERTFKSNNHQSDNDAPNEMDHEEFFKNYYKTLHAANEKVKLEDKNYETYPSYAYRNRRQAQDAGSLDVSVNSNAKEKNIINENEETAIKRHIKKLSEQELEGLLNSLPSEKRALLNKIMESEKDHYDGVSKRDITKKAGAVEENNDIDNGVFDSNKVQGSSVEIKNDVGSHIDTTENTKPSEYNSELPAVTSPKKTSQELTKNKDAITNEEEKPNVNLNEITNNEESKNQVESNIQPSKINIKRETSLNDLENQCSSLSDIKNNNNFNPNDVNENGNDETGYNYQNEDLTQLIGNEALLENNVLGHVNKREALLENTDSFKSLEESFPNSNSYKESGEYSEMDMVPLVRVKRRNEGSLIKKRSALLVPDAKVAHIPYRAENNDDDSEDGNEFEDEGFYDRTLNYAKDNDNNQLSEDDMSAEKTRPKSEKTAQADISRDENIESDTMNIGSDSDSVLSGVEGVDDNLMYNGGVRNRRTAEIRPTDVVNKDSMLSSLTEMESKAPADNLNAVNYQENDAFGPLPKNYEGGLNRLKRIRRVKPCNTVSSSGSNK